jgi:diadenosine tetraphosphate (Ap4A) HIT family hydrolase/GNAT superfamily N-acetyltransferase
MLITAVGVDDIPQWIELAHDVEAIFADVITDREVWYKGFDEYMTAKIRQHEAFMAVDRLTGECMGVIGFSKSHNRISFFAVFEKYRNKGVGSELLRCAIHQLDCSRAITASAFRADYAPGAPSHHIYQKFGFVAHDSTAIEDGIPVCIMRKPPDSQTKTDGSFHYHYGRYMEWSQSEHCPVCCDLPGPPDIVLIRELEHSWLEASMQAQGTLWGKCHLLCKKHYLELHEMPQQDLLDFMTDVQKASKALKTVSGAVKINYEIHGNSVPHLHVHLFPRYIDDPFPSAPIDYRIAEPNPYQCEEGFQRFLNAMKRELEKEEVGSSPDLL